jgi:hypothetical protein
VRERNIVPQRHVIPEAAVVTRMPKKMVLRAAVVACAFTEVAGFSASAAAGIRPREGMQLRRGAARRGICMKDDEINTKKVAG